LCFWQEITGFDNPDFHVVISMYPQLDQF
jgi:hypothetical protein